jgi:hypothetical protein
MEIVDPRNTLLTNQEVMEILNEARERQQQTSRGSQNHNTIVYETLKHWGDTAAATQSREDIIRLAKALKKFRLTGAEVFTIYALIRRNF